MTNKTKRDYDHIFLELAKSLCPVCYALIEAQFIIKEGKVFLKKHCKAHGIFEVLISSDAELYMKSQRFNKPGTIPLHFETKVKNGCPFDCGLCPEHKQHSCLGIIEITQHCNMKCPTCFSNSGPDGHPKHGEKMLSLEQVKFMLDKFIEAEGEPQVVQFSGGEPTLHPELPKMIKEAKARQIRTVMINTNGIRLAKDPKLQETFGKLKPHIYLQFDGFKDSTYKILRGKEDLLEIKLNALLAAKTLGLKVILVATIERGVNDDELGAIIELARNNPSVCGVSFQPVTHVGRHLSFNPKERITNADIIALLAKQTKGLLQVSDFIPVPCCYPDCQYVTYVYTEGGQFLPFPRIVNVEEYLDYIKNQGVPDLNRIVKEAFEGLWSATSVPGTPQLGQKLSLGCCGPDIEIDFDAAKIEENTLMISTISFLDAWTFDVKRAMKCCIAEIVPDGRIIPFCSYNTLYRNR